MSLKEQLDAQRAKSRERIPAETRVLMDQGTESLRQSGIVDRGLKVGDTRLTLPCPTPLGILWIRLTSWPRDRWW
ncbi:MAG: hypothetical protein ETSY1_29195 [Candidatus Entotheonella factor]|uniref:Uncharacterized protein n=1 Tax=Entotheonella factor TaxID=1429438 RepID=W4LCZ5_ENTF1|nr:MAG: hypothetical protein ETSY1_29195 [Candidatus Entotheonella factor]